MSLRKEVTNSWIVGRQCIANQSCFIGLPQYNPHGADIKQTRVVVTANSIDDDDKQ